MSQKQFDIIIIGGGISGLSLASNIASKGKKVLILEGDKDFGGCIKTLYKNKSDFWLEMGAHTFYNKYVNVIKLICDNRLESDIIAREKVGMKVFTDKAVGILSQINILEFLVSIFSSFRKKKEGKDVKEYFSSLLGKKNYNKLFRSLFSAVIVQDADNFSSEYFLKRRKTKNKDLPKSFILKNGMSSLVKRILENDNIEFLNNKTVNKIVKSNSFTVNTEDGNSYTSKDIAFACNPSSASKLISPINNKLSQILSTFYCNDIKTKSYIIDKKKISVDKLSFIIPIQEDNCFSMTTRDVKTDTQYRGFSFHFKPETKAQIEDNIVSTIFNLDNHKQFFAEETTHLLPRISKQHKTIRKNLISEIEKSDFYITGNFFNGLSLEDCVERSRHEYERYTSNNK